MATAAIAAIGALGTLAGGAAALMGQGGRANNQVEQQKLDIANQQLADSRDNEQYQRMVSALINQRAVAGQTDSFG